MLLCDQIHFEMMSGLIFLSAPAKRNVVLVDRYYHDARLTGPAKIVIQFY